MLSFSSYGICFTVHFPSYSGFQSMDIDSVPELFLLVRNRLSNLVNSLFCAWDKCVSDFFPASLTCSIIEEKLLSGHADITTDCHSLLYHTSSHSFSHFTAHQLIDGALAVSHPD